MATYIKDKRVIVTGGARGIGFEDCRHLLIKEAKNVGILDLESADGPAAVVKLNDEFGANRAFFFPTDVSNLDEFEESFNEAVQKLDGVDIIVNNAGICKESSWSSMIDVNIKGMVKGTLLGIETMGKHSGGNGGVVINVSSTAGLIPSVKCLPTYCATKHAVVGFSKSIAESYEKTGVAVKVICPHLTKTDMAVTASSHALNFVDKKHYRELVNDSVVQTPEDVAKTIMRMIEEAPNGAVWMQSDRKAPCAIELPSISSIVVPI